MISPDDLQDIVDNSEVLFKNIAAEIKKYPKSVALTTLVNISTSLFQFTGITKEDFLEMMEQSWDARIEARNKRDV